MSAGVGLDDEALATVGDLAAKLRVDDLRQSGWTVGGPRKEGDGLTWVRASKPFSSPEQAGQAMAELSGPSGPSERGTQGPFREMRLSQDRSFFHTRSGFSGTVDLSGGLSGFIDPELQQQVGDGLDLDLEALRQRFGPSLADVFRVEVVARLPGSIRSNAGTTVDGGVRWAVEPGQSIRLEVEATTFNLVPWLPALVALLAAGGAVAVFLVRRRTS